MENVGLDLGTNSIGISLRDSESGNNLEEQLKYFSSIIFKSGVGTVGTGKTGEFSYAAERTKKRSSRRLYQARKYRIWATLKVLINYGYCPLSIEDLEKWSKYDKAKGLKRQYPIDATKFEQWVRLDFDGDGAAEYSSPYMLRAELMERQFNFDNEIDKFKLGRAIYHIAQRRGFKSSKGETIKEQESDESETSIDIETDLSVALKKSEEKKSKTLVSYMEEHNLKTVGCAFYDLEKNGIRVRNSEYQAVRAQYKEEITEIFKFQKGLDTNSDFFNHIISEKKGEGSIFYKRPLRSQKGLVGKCTLEPKKSRCPISHPEFEKFRAWCFINNIKFRKTNKDNWQDLTLEQKQKLYKEKFLRAKNNFKFEEIRDFLEKATGQPLSYKDSTINYKDNTNISACPISARLKNLLGDDWESTIITTDKERTNIKTGNTHTVSYTAEDLWHICFSLDEPENIEEIAIRDLKFDEKKTKQLVAIYGNIQQGYGMLSLKAIRNINRFLTKGLIYTDAVLLAKLPEIFGDKWEQHELEVENAINDVINSNRKTKQLYNIANTLIANYKSLAENERFAFKDTQYKLDADDIKDIDKTIIDAIGGKTWNCKSESDKNDIKNKIVDLYQTFFASSNRDYYKLPKLADELALYLHDKYPFLNENKLKSVYHPSMIEYYAPAKEDLFDGRFLKLLGSPVIGALKNPMVMRILHTLRKQINDLIIDGKIDEDTRIIVETARDVNDANMRKAIRTYQDMREAENKEFEKEIKRYYPNRKQTDDDIDNVRLLLEQYQGTNNGGKNENSGKTTLEDYSKIKNKEIDKYRLWLEQGCRCLYTGKVINIANLFSENAFDFEHTLPRSMSFDDSLANLTVCDAHYNRAIKKNQMPTELPNYDNDVTIGGTLYTAIKPRLQPWIDKIERLKDNVGFWKVQAKRAQDKNRKDYCIFQRHLWQMELDYWQNKLNRFTMTEVNNGFRNSQLVDTRIITKYAYHYLKTVFNNVEVQKGSTTAIFRKILGIQSLEERKDRGKHSHHAIDATMLTLIPSSAQRDKMIGLFYQREDERKLHGESEAYKHLNDLLNIEIRRCNINGADEIGEFIENNILVNHIFKDQTLTPSHRRKRVRGKIEWKRDKNGNIVHDENGNPIPTWITGDCMRGQLHKDSFFGAIKYPIIDKNGLPIKKDGEYVYETDKDGMPILLMVMNIPIESIEKEKDLEKIVDPIIKNTIKQVVERRVANGDSFTSAIKKPIWLIDKNGKEIKQDKNGHPIHPLRHIRCKVAAGRGYFTKDKALQIKEHIYKSNKGYKNYYYAQNDTNYLCLLYEGVNKDKIERKIDILNYLDISKLDIHSSDDLQEEPYFKKKEDGKKIFNLSAIIKTGTKVLMWKENPDELQELTKAELSKRLYFVYKFNFKGANCVYLQNHIEARPNEEIKEEYTIFDPTKYQPRLTLVANNFNCMIEHRDFELSNNGEIKFL